MRTDDSCWYILLSSAGYFGSCSRTRAAEYETASGRPQKDFEIQSQQKVIQSMDACTAVS